MTGTGLVNKHHRPPLTGWFLGMVIYVRRTYTFERVTTISTSFPIGAHSEPL